MLAACDCRVTDLGVESKELSIQTYLIRIIMVFDFIYDYMEQE